MYIQDKEITLDSDEVPNGYCGQTEYKDDSCEIVLGAANAFRDDRLIVVVYFKRLGLRVKGGKTMCEHIFGDISRPLKRDKLKDKSLWAKNALDYTMASLAKPENVQTLMDLFEHTRKIGFNDGVEFNRQQVKGALGL